MKYKISIVNYLNSKPFLYGLQNSLIINNIELFIDNPAECAKKILQNEVDIALIPVAILHNNNYTIISDYCIGANGNVKTVCLFSQKPIEQIDTIYLDYQSKTSVQLVQILLKEYWKKDVEFLQATPNYETKITNNIAGVIIGDRTIDNFSKFEYCYDLAAIWKLHTNLPFVFAVWASNKNIDANFLIELNNALQFGLENKNNIIKEYNYLNNPNFSVAEYLNSNIDFDLDANKKIALQLFLNKIIS